MKPSAGLILVFALAGVVASSFLMGFECGRTGKSSDESSHWGFPAGEGELKDGRLYQVENFHLASWGYLAQLKETNRMVSRQYRLSAVTNLQSGQFYRADVRDDENSVTGKRTFLVQVGAEAQ